MHTPIPYSPAVQDDAFEQQFQFLTGFTMAIHKPLSSDTQVIRPRWLLTPNGISYSEQSFCQYFDDAIFRNLLRQFLRESPLTHERLMQSLGCFKDEGLILFNNALGYCLEQEIITQEGFSFSTGPQLAQIANLGPTLEWVVMEWLRVDHNALVRRCVQLNEQKQQGDLDVVALFPDSLTMMVECKSSTSTITKDHLSLFVQRAREFQADAALMLIDTAQEEPLRIRTQQLCEILKCDKLPKFRQIQNNSIIYRLEENLFIANTGGGIRMTIRSTVQLVRALKVINRQHSASLSIAQGV